MHETIKLTPSQDKFLDALKAAVAEARTPANRGASKVIEGVANTGTGKATIAALLTEQVFRDDFVLVITPSQGGLPLQTKDRFDGIISGMRVGLLDAETPHIEAETPAGGQVWVTGANSVAVFNAKNQDYTPLITRGNKDGGDREKANLFVWLSEVVKAGIDVTIIQDEAHVGKSADARSIRRFLADLRSVIRTAGGAEPIVVELTATPVAYEASARASFHRLVVLPTDDAVRDGLIRKHFALNFEAEALNNVADTVKYKRDFRISMLEAALKRQVALRELYAREDNDGPGLSVWPLIAIQLPNTDEGRTVRAEIEEYLATYSDEYTREEIAGGEFVDHHITAEGKAPSVAIYLSGEKKSDVMENIAAHDSPVRVLIYKTGLSLGWDCPRAQILLGFRRLGTAQFSKQNRGRFRRTLERKIYGGEYEPLNWAYIYADEDTLQGLVGEDGDGDENGIVRLPADGNKKKIVDSWKIRRGHIARRNQRPVETRLMYVRAGYFLPAFVRSYRQLSSVPGTVQGAVEVSLREGNHAFDTVSVSNDLLVRTDITVKSFAGDARRTTIARIEYDKKPYQKYLEERVNGNGRVFARKALIAEDLLKVLSRVLRENLETGTEAGTVLLDMYPGESPRKVLGNVLRNTMPRTSGARALEEWVDLIFGDEDATLAKMTFEKEVEGKKLVLPAEVPADDNAVERDGLKQDEWKAELDGPYSVPLNEYSVLEGDGSNIIRYVVPRIYQFRDGEALPIGARRLTAPEVAFEEELAGVGEVAFFEKNGAGNNSIRIPIAWVKDGKTYTTDFYPDYYGALNDGIDAETGKPRYRPFILEVKGRNPDGLDSLPGKTAAKHKGMVRYAKMTGIVCGVVFPTDSKTNTDWRSYGTMEPAFEALRASYKEQYAPLADDADLTWMLEPIQL